MIIKSQTGDKIVFLESGCICCIELTTDEMLEDDELGFFNGKFSGYSDTFPYAIVCYNPAGQSFRLGVYENREAASDVLEWLIQGTSVYQV